jgi:hypothetical protein
MTNKDITSNIEREFLLISLILQLIIHRMKFDKWLQYFKYMINDDFIRKGAKIVRVNILIKNAELKRGNIVKCEIYTI